MEHKKTPEQPTVKQLLGSDHETGREPGIIKEYQGFIQRHAYDYLMVGFATDIDQVEEQREARFEAYLDSIEADFAMYQIDVAKWNQDHLDNVTPATWQAQIVEGQLVRRTDLPVIEVCEQALITSTESYAVPSREQVRAVSQEGIDKFYDQALSDSYELLTSRLEAIAVALPTAPLERDSSQPKTFSELIAERQLLTDRQIQVKSRMKDIPSELLSAPFESTDYAVRTRDELLEEHQLIRSEYATINSRLATIKQELPNARLDDAVTRAELVREYALIVSRMNTIEDIQSEREAQNNHFVSGIEARHTLIDELRPVTGKLAIIGHKVLQMAGIRLS